MEESDIGGDKSLFLSTEVLKDVIVDNTQGKSQV